MHFSYELYLALCHQGLQDGQSRLINRDALFADGTQEYRIPSEPELYDRVTFRFRTQKQEFDEVALYINGDKLLMHKADSDDYFDYYEVNKVLYVTSYHYYFEVKLKSDSCYYLSIGAVDKVYPEYEFHMTPGFKTPDWAKGAIFYQIFVDRFYNGDTSNDVRDNEYVYIGEGTKEVNKWKKYPESMDVREFYGGDLAGVIKKLDYLKSLGVQVIYLNPIFVSPSNHKYDIQDYDYVDPHFGRIIKEAEKSWESDSLTCNKEATGYITRVTDKENLEASNQLFIEMVQEIHKRGMKVILDGVFNHCGSFNKWMDRERIYENVKGYEPGAYIDEKSVYRNYFDFRSNRWPYNDSYEGWWGHDTLPKLNYEASKELYDYIMKVARKWVAPPYDADGWRLDVAADLGHSESFNHQFWRDFRDNVRSVKKDALIIAEHYGDASNWLKGDQWDTVMNYDAFMEPITWFLTGMEKHSDEFHPELIGNHDFFICSMKHFMSRFQQQSLFVAMNELSNHDHSRFLTRTNHTIGRTQSHGPQAAGERISYGLFRIAVVMQFTWPGAPTIYYGDEAGLCGWTDPDNRRTYPWGNEDKPLIKLHTELAKIHSAYDALKIGSFKFLNSVSQVVSYGRFDSVDKILVAVNVSSEYKTMHIEVWQIGLTKEEQLYRLIETDAYGFDLSAQAYQVKDGKLHITLKPCSAVIIKNYAHK